MHPYILFSSNRVYENVHVYRDASYQLTILVYFLVRHVDLVETNEN